MLFSILVENFNMKHVSFSSIEAAIKVVDNLDDDQLETISKKYADAQPILLNYVMSAPEEYENDELSPLLIYYFCLISECFEQQGLSIKSVTEDDIDQFEEPYFELLDSYFDSENEEILDDFCDQPELIRFMLMEISTEDEDGTSFDDETATQLFIVSAAMISLMGRSIRA